MRVFLLPGGNLLVAKCQHSVEKRKHKNFVYWLPISLKRNKIWLLFTVYSSSGETLLKGIKFYLSNHMASMGFHVWNEHHEFLFSFDLFLSHCIPYFIRCTGALPSGVWINQLAIIKSMLSFPFLTNKMPHFFISQLEKRQKKGWILRSMHQTQHICK